MRVYVIKTFRRFQRKEHISDAALREAVDRAEEGLADADLGGGLIKQRIAREGQGRRGGYRTIIAYRAGERAVFLYGFAKNERENLDSRELARWRAVGRVVLESDENRTTAAIADGELTEVEP
jgi:hypothetical protein